MGLRLGAVLIAVAALVGLLSCQAGTDDGGFFSTGQNGCVPPAAIGGRLDLVGWDFERCGAVALDGQWLMQPGVLARPDDLLVAGRQAVLAVEQPGIWNRMKGIQSAAGDSWNGLIAEGKGCATSQLVIVLPAEAAGRPLGLRISHVYTAYQLFVNGRLQAGNGQVSCEADGSRAQYLPQTVFFNPLNGVPNSFSHGNLALTLQVSNHHHRKGGLSESVLLGRPQDLQPLRERRLMSEMLIVGILLIIGLYHVLIHLLRFKERSAVLFALACFILCLRTLLMGERILYLIFPQFPWVLGQTLDYLTITCFLPVFTWFIYEQFPGQLHRQVLRAVFVLSGLFTLVIIVTPPTVFTHLLAPFNMIMIICGIFILTAVIKAVVRNMPGARVLVLGMVALFLAYVNDTLHNQGMIHSLYLAPTGLMMFTIAQTAALSMQMSHKFNLAYQKVASLSQELKEYSETLEIKVAERTEEVNRKNKGILESIEYASVLQSSVLPDASILKQYINKPEVIWHPRDVVGGDFYWLHEGFSRVDKQSSAGGCGMVLLGDCTGHGVPGALMAMTVLSQLQSLDHAEIKDPADLLTRLNQQLRVTLAKNRPETVADDGLDLVAVQAVPHLSSGSGDEAKAYEILWAGAKLGLYHQSGDNISYFRGDRTSIGYRRSDNNFVYRSRRLAVKPGDRLFLTSDGIIDQNGGGKGFSWGRRRFLETLRSAAQMPIAEQIKHLMQVWQEYKGSEGQRDDICLLAWEIV